MGHRPNSSGILLELVRSVRDVSSLPRLQPPQCNWEVKLFQGQLFHSLFEVDSVAQSCRQRPGGPGPGSEMH